MSHRPPRFLRLTIHPPKFQPSSSSHFSLSLYLSLIVPLVITLPCSKCSSSRICGAISSFSIFSALAECSSPRRPLPQGHLSHLRPNCPYRPTHVATSGGTFPTPLAAHRCLRTIGVPNRTAPRLSKSLPAASGHHKLARTLSLARCPSRLIMPFGTPPPTLCSHHWSVAQTHHCRK